MKMITAAEALQLSARAAFAEHLQGFLNGLKDLEAEHPEVADIEAFGVEFEETPEGGEVHRFTFDAELSDEALDGLGDLEVLWGRDLLQYLELQGTNTFRREDVARWVGAQERVAFWVEGA